MNERQKLEQVRNNLLAQAEDIELFLNGAQISILSARIEKDRVLIRWQSDSAGEFDFQWYNTEYQQPWQNSRTKWTPGEFPDLSDELHDFGLNPGRDKSHDDKWKVRAVSLEGEPLTESVYVKSEEPEEPETPEPTPEPLKLFTAFWSSNQVPENDLKKLMTAGHDSGLERSEMQKIVNEGRKVIPGFGGFRPDHTDRQLRDRVGWYTDTFEKIGWENIEYILLTDEPIRHKRLSKRQCEVIAGEANRLYNAPVGYTFQRGTIIMDELPENIDVIGINFYPFFDEGSDGYPHVFTYEEFSELFSYTLDKAREKVPGKPFVITAQVFGNRTASVPWRVPEPETSEWYLKAISEHPDIIGLTFWGWDAGHRWIGFSELPELQQAWVEAIQGRIKP